MSQTKLMSELDNVLKKGGERYYLDGVLNKARVIEDLHNYDPELIILLSESDIVKKHFLIEINGNKILKTNDLIEIFEMNEYWSDSYTSYENKIGVSSNGKFLSDNTDVVLDFPYKDTVLKATMSKEEVEKGDLLPEEPFLNEVIAREEIDTLFDNKVLVNAVKYDEEGSHKVNKISKEDNLIMKGNNLLALHSLKERYSGKIKFITIDPPYYFNKQKSSDAFKYNSNFKLSTWLVFMKNRLEVAKELLTDDGLISIIIGEDGYAHLKLLSDSIFNAENYVTTIAWRKTDNQSNIGEFANVKDYILLYKKSPNARLGRLPLSEKAQKEYSYEDHRGRYRRSNILDQTRGKHYYNITTPNGSILSGPWMITEEEFNNLRKNDTIHWPERGEQIPYGKTYLSHQIDKGQIPNDFWDASYGTNQRGAEEMKNLFESRVFDFPKPEKLLMNLISIGSNEEDIVLDFFMGSATTQAVAQKMNRRYIGIEQMDYVNTISIPRLQKVLEGEQGGISKDVDWQGGGSFVYVELMEKNTGYLKAVIEAESTDRLREIFNIMLENADFDFRVDLEEVKDSVWRLPLEEQKRTLVKIIDKNQLYYNYSEIDDENVRDLISDTDYEFNKSFYS